MQGYERTQSITKGHLSSELEVVTLSTERGWDIYFPYHIVESCGMKNRETILWGCNTPKAAH